MCDRGFAKFRKVIVKPFCLFLHNTIMSNMQHAYKLYATWLYATCLLMRVQTLLVLGALKSSVLRPKRLHAEPCCTNTSQDCTHLYQYHSSQLMKLIEVSWANLLGVWGPLQLADDKCNALTKPVVHNLSPLWICLHKLSEACWLLELALFRANLVAM